MAALPPIPPNYVPIFESYWLQLEGSSSGDVNAITAATFLKKSQLKEALLHKIWDLSDPGGKGYLDKQGFFVALRLVAACQCGREPSLKSIQVIDPPPKFVGLEQTAWSIDANERAMYNSRFERLQPINGLLSGEKVRNFLMQSQLPVDTLGKIWHLSDLDRDGSLDADEFAIALKLTSMAQKGEVIPLVLPQSLVPATKAARLGLAPPAGVTSSLTARTPSPVGGNNASDWVVTPDIKAKYDAYFTGIDKDHDGIVSGDEAKNLFMSSNLPHTALANIWRLCDIDNNGRLNKEQFALAMYLIAEKVKGKELPTELAPNMIPPSKRKGAAGSVVTSQTGSLSAPSSTSSLYSGGVKLGGGGMGGALLQPTSTTSSILAPTSTTPTSFPATMGGVAPPTNLMTTSSGTTLPSLGGGAILQPKPLQPGFGGSPLLGNKGLTPTSSATSIGFSADFSAIRDLDSISNEIEDVRREKAQLQEDIAAKKEILTKAKEEVGGVQNELEETTRLNQQLELQKKEIQNRIDEVNNQRTKLEGVISELKLKCQKEKEEIELLKGQYREQEVSITSQQDEVSRLQQQLTDLQQEEENMKSKIETSRQELMRLQSENQTVQLSIDQMKMKFDEYQSQQQQLTAQLAALPTPSAGSGEGGASATPTMRVGELPVDFPSRNLLSEPDAISARATAGSSSPVSSISGFSTASHLEEQSEERERTETLTADPFASFPDPFTGAGVSGGGGGEVPPIGGDFSSFDPFGLTGFKTTPTTSTNNTTSDFASFSAFSTNFSSSTTPPVVPASANNVSTNNKPFVANFGAPPITTSSATNGDGGGVKNVDPFQTGSDPFSSDPFLSVATPKASDQSGHATGWGGVSPFSTGTDPFASTSASTTTNSSKIDPFFSTDPFGTTGTDPFGDVNPFETTPTTGGGGGLDPFSTLTNTNTPSSQK